MTTAGTQERDWERTLQLTYEHMATKADVAKVKHKVEELGDRMLIGFVGLAVFVTTATVTAVVVVAIL